MALKNVIFDLDGTLVDSLPGIEYSVDCALRETGHPARTGSLRPHVGPPVRTILQEASGQTHARELDLLESAFRRSYDSEGWKKTLLNPGARETLSWLAAAKLRAYLVTNKPEEPTRRIANHFGLTGMLSGMISPDSTTPRSRTKLEMLRRVMDGGAKAEDSLVVGDTLDDWDAAVAAGMHAVILASGYGGATIAACRCVETLQDIQPLIAEFGGLA